MGYRINQVIETGNKKIQTGTEEYIKFLKVIGNNYKYSASAQLNIYCINPKAKACAEYEFWKNRVGRTVKLKEKGIPIYSVENGEKKVKYIFDVSQTRVNSEKDKFRLWKFETEHKEIFQKLSGISDFKEGKEEIIIELKIINGTENLSNDKIHEKLEKECEVALNQIDEKGYNSVLKNAGIKKVLKIGIAFLGKEFEVKFKKEEINIY